MSKGIQIEKNVKGEKCHVSGEKPRYLFEYEGLKCTRKVFERHVAKEIGLRMTHHSIQEMLMLQEGARDIARYTKTNGVNLENYTDFCKFLYTLSSQGQVINFTIHTTIARKGNIVELRVTHKEDYRLLLVANELKLLYMLYKVEA